MSAITEGDYLFVHYGYGADHQPELSLLADGSDTFVQLQPRGQTLTLAFDTSQRYCSGWHDLASTASFPCPDGAELPSRYDQCRHCQQKTGFNPAFYHATTVSDQQLARNQLPHLLYLAHFAPGVVKVGITWAERGIRRLLDQGARSGLIIKTYPNADVARNYEAKSAQLPGIAETLQLRHKLQLLKRPYDAEVGMTELLAARDRLRAEAGVAPDDTPPLQLDRFYFAGNDLQPRNIIDVNKNNTISGTCIGMLGSVLVTAQDGLQFALPLGKLNGYRCTLSYNEQANSSEPQQIGLF